MPTFAPVSTDRGRHAPDPCYHCGLPNPRGGRWQAIAQGIDAAGLVAYYEQRTASAARIDSSDALGNECAPWDDAAAQARVVRRDADGRHEISLLLEGVQCSACAWLIEAWLERAPGV